MSLILRIKILQETFSVFPYIGLLRYIKMLQISSIYSTLVFPRSCFRDGYYFLVFQKLKQLLCCLKSQLRYPAENGILSL